MSLRNLLEKVLQKVRVDIRVEEIHAKRCESWHDLSLDPRFRRGERGLEAWPVQLRLVRRQPALPARLVKHAVLRDPGRVQLEAGVAARRGYLGFKQVVRAR